MTAVGNVFATWGGGFELRSLFISTFVLQLGSGMSLVKEVLDAKSECSFQPVHRVLFVLDVLSVKIYRLVRAQPSLLR